MKSITISGDLGSGKSLVAKALAQTLACSYISTGTIQRGIAAEMNMTTLELNRYSETHPEIDERIDSIFAELDQSGDCYIVDSRMAWHFLKRAVKVHLVVDVEVAARRIMGDTSRNSVETYGSLEQAKADLLSRKQSENVRFLEKYQADCSALGNYDIIVETSVARPEEVTACILDCYNSLQGREKRFFLSPKTLVPGKPANEAASRQSGGTPAGGAAGQAGPIEVAVIDGFYYIVEGNDEASAALAAGVPLVPVCLLSPEDRRSREAAASVTRELLSRWEERHSFRFLNYPRL